MFPYMVQDSLAKKKTTSADYNIPFSAMRITCNETFEKLVEKYLASSDRVLVEIKEEYMDKAFKGAKYFNSEVEVDLSSITEFDP